MPERNTMLADLDFTLFDNDPKDVERCGIILALPGGGPWEFVEVPNVAEDSAKDFAIGQDDVDAVIESRPPGYQFIGWVHTHLPDEIRQPSTTDMQNLPKATLGIVYYPDIKLWILYDDVAPITRGFKR